MINTKSRGGKIINTEIECFYQREAKKYIRFDSDFFPSSLRNIHRLKIFGPEGKFGHLLTGLEFPNIVWIVFNSSCTTIEDLANNAKSYDLSWFQKFKLQRLYNVFSDDKLFYMTGSLPEMINDASTSTLWEDGAGIALPVMEPMESSLAKAIDVQVSLGKKLKKAITDDFKCIILANADANGVDVLWSESWSFASKTEEWAIDLASKYKWIGHPFLMKEK